jgi:hypothetical protein
MWRIAGLAGLVAAALALGAHVGCSTQAAGVSCPPGSMVVCSCNGSLTGQAQCDSSGHEGECLCNGDSGGSSGSSSGSGSGSSSGGGSGSGSGGTEGGTPSGDSGAEDGALGD